MNDSGSIIWQDLLIFIFETSRDVFTYHLLYSSESALVRISIGKSMWKEVRLGSVSRWDQFFFGFFVYITYSINSELYFSFSFLLLLLFLRRMVQSFYGWVLHRSCEWQTKLDWIDWLLQLCQLIFLCMHKYFIVLLPFSLVHSPYKLNSNSES